MQAVAMPLAINRWRGFKFRHMDYRHHLYRAAVYAPLMRNTTHATIINAGGTIC